MAEVDIRRRTKSSSDAINESGAIQSVLSKPKTDCYRVVVMGAAGVGKTCIINRFLYENFLNDYKATIEELHRGEYSVNGATITLDILDTTGSYAFPAMRKLSITTGNAFLLVYSLGDDESFEEVKNLRQQILEIKRTNCDSLDPTDDHLDPMNPPIVIVGNKLDLCSNESTHKKDREMPKVAVESLVNIDWNHGYVEASAKENININGIFKELLSQAKVQLLTSPAVIRKRRQSLPASSSKNSRRKDSCRVS
ncbi:hypothetical protein CAPTEDRAFT_156740 [Capitella teleta]|uniref:Small monomeric GTPase n=1 Tax=Capitella teleta TaxID=283909 RepID=R7U5N7_CAPTE|nr:hypothetical protein CAPTEDRAFT_156740 [Capitella teleta]|eukprot:ELU01289.1 hypothetical protein CAPTEDRAFT_156740 [Capitella teleta]